MERTIHVIAQSLQQPRVVKRIISKAKDYDFVKVYGFKRDFYDVGNINKLKEIANVEVEIIGVLKNEKYFQRIFLYFKLLFLLNLKKPFGKKQVYVFGPDLRFICFFLVNANISYEIADIMWLYKSGFVRNLLRKIDYFLCRRSQLVIFTSEGFYKHHYSFLNKEKVKIIENKFKTYGMVKPLQNIVLDQIRVAYIGSLRYGEIINALLKVFSRNPQWQLNFYGDGFSEIVETIKKNSREFSNITFFGAFNNPEDLQKIYGENNLNFVAYDNNLDNELVAMPNKFYESGFFNMPIVASKGTFVGEKILELQMGWVINPTEHEIENFLKGISLGDLSLRHEAIKELDKANFEMN